MQLGGFREKKLKRGADAHFVLHALVTQGRDIFVVFTEGAMGRGNKSMTDHGVVPNTNISGAQVNGESTRSADSDDLTEDCTLNSSGQRASQHQSQSRKD